MSDIWCPWTKKNVAPQHLWGPEQMPDAGVLHTTESKSFTPGETYFGHTYFPNATVSEHGVWEHIPINRAARALANKPGGVETNNSGCYQIEIVWNAADIRNAPKQLMENLRRFMRWVEEHSLIPRGCSVAFLPYPKSYGSAAGNRLPNDKWISYTGWLGHQHTPENDHGDPGDIDIEWLLDLQTQEDEMTPEQMAILIQHIDKRTDEVKREVQANALGILSHIARSQKTAILYRIEGEKEPWYGLVGGRVVGPFNLQEAIQFKRQHEITEPSIEISKEFHDIYSAGGV